MYKAAAERGIFKAVNENCRLQGCSLPIGVRIGSARKPQWRKPSHIQGPPTLTSRRVHTSLRSSVAFSFHSVLFPSARSPAPFILTFARATSALVSFPFNSSFIHRLGFTLHFFEIAPRLPL